jgi:hypothetical protein
LVEDGDAAELAVNMASVADLAERLDRASVDQRATVSRASNSPASSSSTSSRNPSSSLMRP